MFRKAFCLSAVAGFFVFITSTASGQAHFLRGDSNHDKTIDISDGINTLSFLFLGTGTILCRDASDINDSGAIDIADAVFTFNFLFSGGAQPAAPWPVFEADPTPDATSVGGELGCLGPPEIIDGDPAAAGIQNITADMTLVRSKVYLLRGTVFVDPPAILTIEEGTTILGDAGAENRGVLVVERGAKLVAVGTETHPVVFTTVNPVGSRSRGNWGGIILLGRAQNNAPGGESNVEGIVGHLFGGGLAPQNDDSSGQLSYVRIEFGGFAISPNNEVNALTIAGCGSGTQLDHIQVKFNDDDGFEWFGGTASLKYGLVSYVNDDSFDYSFGWQGMGQFWVAHQRGDIAGCGFEVDNQEAPNPFTSTPVTRPTISNVTLVGVGDPAAPSGEQGILWRRGTGPKAYNTIVQGFKGVGIDIDDEVSCTQNQADGFLTLESSVFYSNGAGGTTHSPPAGSETGAQDEATWLDPCTNKSAAMVATASNIVATTSPTVDPHNLTAPNFQPQNDALTAPFDPTGIDSFFEPAPFRGAVAPETPENPDWTKAPWISYAQN
jgi:hypothetical protein